MYQRFAIAVALSVIGLCTGQPARSEAQPQDEHPGQAGTTADELGLDQDLDGHLQEKEYRCISSNCSVTRAVCPHTCEDRGLARENCQTWRSKSNEQECYVKDTRYDTDVMPNSPL